MQDRYEDLRVKVKALPGSRRARAALIKIDHSTLGRFERRASQTLATIRKIEKGLAALAEGTGK